MMRFSNLVLSTFLFVTSSVSFGYGGDSDADVIIIGAGFSGLAAGKYFHEQNISFIILEANDYLGGRVKNQDWHGHSAPLGAGWIHSANENHVVQQKAVKYNMTYYNDSYAIDNIAYVNAKDGSVSPNQEITKARDALDTAIEAMDELVEARVENGRGSIDLKSGLRWAGFVPKTPVQNALEYWKFNFENGIEPDVIDAIAYGFTKEDENVGERVVTDPRGYSYPVVHEAQPYINKIKLNKTVTEINQESDKTFTVKGADGSSYTSKKVLVTVSTGVLQANTIKFAPNFPAWKLEALNMFPMAHYCKFYMTFSNVFWDNTKGYFMLATQRKGHFVHWQNFNKDGLFPGSKMLQGLLTGVLCLESYTFTDEEIKTQVFDVLKTAYTNATRPTDLLRNRFSVDPNFEGSYSYQVAGVNEDDYLAFEHPIRQSLYFAGEAYMRWEFGYAHGAYDNGLTAAENITKCLKDADTCPTDSPLFVMKKDCQTSAGVSSFNVNLMAISALNVLAFVVQW